MLYDVCHNIAKVEQILLNKQMIEVCIHRKGATRAFPAGHVDVPPQYRKVGQPILVPGDMGRQSFILAGRKDSIKQSMGSACHGAGRELSRSEAKRRGKGRSIISELETRGIIVKAAGRDTLLEEMPEAYKDVSEVVQATEQAKIASIVARLRPIGAIKG